MHLFENIHRHLISLWLKPLEFNLSFLVQSVIGIEDDYPLSCGVAATFITDHQNLLISSLIPGLYLY